jgi:hypothetical protein
VWMVVILSSCVDTEVLPRERLPRKSVFYYRNPIKKTYSLSIVFAFDREDDVYFFAYSFPYT